MSNSNSFDLLESMVAGSLNLFHHIPGISLYDSPVPPFADQKCNKVSGRYNQCRDANDYQYFALGHRYPPVKGLSGPGV